MPAGQPLQLTSWPWFPPQGTKQEAGHLPGHPLSRGHGFVDTASLQGCHTAAPFPGTKSALLNPTCLLCFLLSFSHQLLGRKDPNQTCPSPVCSSEPPVQLRLKMQTLCPNLDVLSCVPVLDRSSRLQPPRPSCVCSAEAEGHRHATSTQRDPAWQSGASGCTDLLLRTRLHGAPCSAPQHRFPPRELLATKLQTLQAASPRGTLPAPGRGAHRVCAQGCVRVCKAGERAQRRHSLAQGKEFLPRAAYHLGNLRFPAEPPARRSMSYPELCYKQPGTPADRRLPRGSTNAQAPPSPWLCGKQDPVGLPRGTASAELSASVAVLATAPSCCELLLCMSSLPRTHLSLLPAPVLCPRDLLSSLCTGCP